MNNKEKISNQGKKIQGSSTLTTIHSLTHEGRGIATVDNKPIFMEYGLPEETVSYQITQKKSNYSVAKILERMNDSPLRERSICQHFGTCGGCSLQHMSLSTQVELKQNTLLQQLEHFGRVKPLNVLPPLVSTSEGYRRKARLGVKFVDKKNKMLVGFREKSSRYLADLAHCPVLHPNVGERLEALAELVRSLDHYRAVPQIEVAMGDQVTAFVFRYMGEVSEGDQQKLIQFGKKTNIHIYLQPDSPKKISKLWPFDNEDWLTYTLPQQELEFLFHPLDFTQVNLEMNRLMVSQVLDLLSIELHDKVLDLFCGIGNFTLPMAKFAQHVTAVEGSVEMVERAKRNALHNHIENVDFHVADLQQLTKQGEWSQNAYDKILIDPPRVGAKEILPYLHHLSAKKIIYVSCNPATLARDAGEMVHQYGYQLTQVGMMNMFPHTSHTEAVAVFQK